MEKPGVYVTRTACGWNDGGHGWNYISPANIEKLKTFAAPVIEDSGPEPVPEPELIRKCAGIRAILMSNGAGGAEITEHVLRAVGTVEVIVLAHSDWGGIPWKAAARCGIKTIEGSNAIDKAVAEWTIGTAIMGRRNLLDAGESLKEEGRWQKNWRQAALLCGSTVGVLGLGRVGRIALRHFKELGANVIAYDRYFDPVKAAELGVELVGLDDLLKTADVVSLHLPVTPETTGLLGKKEFALIKNGATFLNSARAKLYDAEALVGELKKGRFQAFIDVYPDEVNMHDADGNVKQAHPFYREVHTLPNVYLSSHIAGTNDAMYELAGTEAIETLRHYFETGEPRDSRTL